MNVSAIAAERPDEPARARVLVVEDDAATRGLVRQALKGAGYEVLEASSGNEAGELLSRRSRQGGRIDLVIAAITPPDGTGLDALATLRQQRRPVPVILMAPAVGREIYHEAIRLGAAAVLPKPLDLQQLVLAVRVRVFD